MNVSLREEQNAAEKHLEAMLLEAMLLEGIESLRKGEGTEATPALWESLKERFRAKHGRKLGSTTHE